MAEDRMMTPADVVARAMAGEHGDLLRDAVALVVRELMDGEVATLTGAARGERTPERVTNLNGYRSSVALVTLSPGGGVRDIVQMADEDANTPEAGCPVSPSVRPYERCAGA